MSNSVIYYILILAVSCNFVRTMRLPLAANPLEHRIGDVLQRVSIINSSNSTNANQHKDAIPPLLRSDIRATAFALQEIQHHISSIWTVQKRIQEKLSQWQDNNKITTNPVYRRHQFADDESLHDNNLSRQVSSSGSLVEHQMANVFQRVSSSQRSRNPQRHTTESSNKDDVTSKEVKSIRSIIKEAVSALQETRLKMSSIVAVQSDLEERLNYWQTQLMNNSGHPVDSAEPDRATPKQYMIMLPYHPDNIESKSDWLLAAFKRNRSQSSLFWMLAGASWTWSTSGDETALQWAVDSNWYEVVELLVKWKSAQDCWIRSSTGFKETILHYAVRRGAEVPLFRLLVRGCDVNATESEHNRTPLHLAAELDRLELAELLIKEGGAVVEAQDRAKFRPIHFAVQLQRLDMAKLLIRAGGADIEAQDHLGNRPIHFAIKNPAMVRMLLAFEANLFATTITGMTALHMAVIDNQMETVKTLLNAGPNLVIAYDSHGYTPMDYAKMLGLPHKDMQSLLAPDYAVFETIHLNTISRIRESSV